MNSRLRSTAAVFFGGALGSLLRFAVGLILPSFASLFAVNLLGAAALGWVQGRAYHPGHRLANPRAQEFWGTGFCGGFTTMSGLAAFVLLQQQAVGTFATLLYIFTQLVLGLVVHRVAIGVAARGGVDTDD